MEALERAWVAQAVVDRFDGRQLDFKTADCARLGLFVCRAMGHRPVGLNSVRWGSRNGALKALRRNRFANLIEAVDAQGFERIAPARAWPGDLIAMPGPDPWGCALAVAIGSGKVFGFVEEDGVTVGRKRTPLEFVTAWRVPCRR